MKCTHCGSEDTKKNGHTHYAKQNYYCKHCKHQFVEGGQEWFVSESEKIMIKKLLLERISLEGICRVMGLSPAWLANYVVKVYESSPDDLNVVLELPNKTQYLEDRFEEEIQRIKKKKADKLVQNYTEVADYPNGFEIEPFDNDLFTDNSALEDDYFAGLEMSMPKDLLMTEVYSQDRGLRVLHLGIQLDEIWSFVGNKDQKQWIWLALNPVNRQIIAFHIGDRTEADARILYENIPAYFKGDNAFFSDYWQAYVPAFANEQHFSVGKESGLTA